MSRKLRIVLGVAVIGALGVFQLVSWVPSSMYMGLFVEPEPIPELTVYRVAPVALPSALPFVGVDGDDAYGYPRKTADGVALLALLRARRFAQLSEYLTAYQTAFEADHRKEYWALDSADAFGITDPELGPLIEEWAAADPDGFAPPLARARHRAALGWFYRGTGYAEDTPESWSFAARAELGAARADALVALERRPNLISAHRTLMELASFVGHNEALEKTYLAARAQCPDCWTLRFKFLMSLTPWWHGDQGEAFIAFANLTAGEVALNPKFESARAFVPWLQCETARRGGQYTVAELHCTAALELGENAAIWETRAKVLSRLGHHERALRDLDKALEALPGSASFRRARVREFIGLDQFEEAGHELLALGRLDPTDDLVSGTAPWLVGRLIALGSKAARDGEVARGARMCALAMDLRKDGQADGACVEVLYRNPNNGKFLQAAAVAAPDDFVAQRHADYAYLLRRQHAQSVAVWDRYLARHPDDPRGYAERGGAHFHAGDKAASQADAKRACDMGLALSCAHAE